MAPDIRRETSNRGYNLGTKGHSPDPQPTRGRRLGKRIPAILEGRARLDPRGPQIPCTIRDLSLTGARIWFPVVIDLPQEFELEIPLLEQTVRVRVAWSQGRTRGVMFLGTLREPAGDGGLDLLRKLQAPEDATEHKAALERPAPPVQKKPVKPETLWQRLRRRSGR